MEGKPSLFFYYSIFSMTMNARSIHRDLAYFYLGLIISFALSGILLNHRAYWHPEKYTIETKSITQALPQNEKEINDKFVEDLVKQLNINDKFRRFFIREGSLRLSYEKHDVEINIKTGKGEIIQYIKTPFIAQSIQLHKDTSDWWIYYSDIFGLAMLVIAFTGPFITTKGKYSYKNRGWKLTLVGIIFPLIFLFLLS